MYEVNQQQASVVDYGLVDLNNGQIRPTGVGPLEYKLTMDTQKGQNDF